MDIDECIKKGFIRKVQPDRELMKSLLKTSENKYITVSKAEVNDISISSYVSLAYDALREILEGICIQKGYKVTSHQCLGELLKKEPYFEYYEFDRMRYIRNGINYYGKEIDLEQGKELIKKIFLLREKLKKEIEKTQN